MIKNDKVCVFLSISKLEIMHTNTHESEIVLIHTKTLMKWILEDRKKPNLFPFICYINNYYLRNIKKHEAQKDHITAFSVTQSLYLRIIC
jgi:hypothetical protein